MMVPPSSSNLVQDSTELLSSAMQDKAEQIKTGRNSAFSAYNRV